MDYILRNVADLPADERRLYESVLGQTLYENQQILVQLVNTEASKMPPPKANGTTDVLEPYAMWADLSDQEITELESAILVRSDSRPT